MDSNQFEDILYKYPSAQLLLKGGQKQVYLIDYQGPGKAVLKVGAYDEPVEIERIMREVEVLRDIESKYYPKNYEFNEETNKRFVIIEEYIESTSLTQNIKNYTDIPKAVHLMIDIITGLQELWKRNIVHRDVKPDNILITPNGDARIIDLGIARLLDRNTLTKLGLNGPGTEQYAAPEQLRYIEYGKALIGHRTDQFNLGIILAQLLLNGYHPFHPDVVGTAKGNLGSIAANIDACIWQKEFFDRQEMSTVKPVLEKMLARHPHKRYRTPEKLIEALSNCIGEE
ncbi:serine/threonine protein kinase [Herpetosiphon llansteffanensis]|uniref:serine/threonine protein kinase n=1 Tax=Herpetosiphon llansteffanensis TaxID=2094568 RepID=UPI000D7CE3F5|nr:serine/threonine-protein kinase [Herpetosiphon llansteffanensis]